MTCIYHSKDLDGWMSAAIVKLRYPDVKLIGWNYGDTFPLGLDRVYDDVIMVDISFTPDIMLALTKLNGLIWIDHHERTIYETEEYFNDHGMGYKMPLGLRISTFAACELTWKYLFPDQPMPELVRLLGRYDCFGHKGTDEELRVLEFQYGARQWISNPEEALQYLKIYLKSEYEATAMMADIYYAGTSIFKYLCVEAKQKYAQRFTLSFPEPLDDGSTLYSRTFACVNGERFNPINFGIDYHKDGYDGFACFWYEKGNWNFSFYNDNGNVDCSAIAKQFGGGGHKGASGARIQDLDTIIK